MYRVINRRDLSPCTLEFSYNDHSEQVIAYLSLSFIAERDEGIWSFVDSFWFALMTLTTVGYDLNPVTLLGKVCFTLYRFGSNVALNNLAFDTE